MENLNYKHFIYISLIIICTGISFTTAFKDNLGTIGKVTIAVGVVFPIIGMAMKRQNDENK
ncbi:MAG: hypothetical protein HQ521_03715 [Bacteroidetes bacterium]|nr:hypothetical protein [Bacteroidota bacterium]